MFKYILRRLLIMIPVLIGLTIVVFLLVNVLPGDTARIIAGDYADEATVQSIREAYGLDKPIHIQYINYIKDLLHGDSAVPITAGATSPRRSPTSIPRPSNWRWPRKWSAWSWACCWA